MDQDIKCRIRETISEIEEKSAFGNYIFRGEPEKHEEKPHCGKVSSNLWRKYGLSMESFDIEVVQMEMLNGAKKHMGELPQDFSGESTGFLNVIQVDDPDDFEILTKIQHYGGKTNLIDFTTDYFIALFFACDGHHNKEGRVILQDFGEIRDMINHPRNPRHRVIAQKSVFVRPPKGFIIPNEDDIVTISADLKQWILQHLRKYHGISKETIYNDIYGYIRNQGIHGQAYTWFYQGVACQKRGSKVTIPKESQKEYEESIKHYTQATQSKPDFLEAYYNRGVVFATTGNYDDAIADFDVTIGFNSYDADAYNQRGIAYYKLKKYKEAIADYTKATQLKPDLADAYYNRGEAFLRIKKWEEAEADIITAKKMGVDIVVLFRNDYKSVEAFKEKNGFELPYKIATILTPT